MIATGEQSGFEGLRRRLPAGLPAYTADVCRLFAPSRNAHRRIPLGSQAPARVTRGVKNRIAAVRVCFGVA